jgi:hypothetical protein
MRTQKRRSGLPGKISRTRTTLTEATRYEPNGHLHAHSNASNAGNASNAIRPRHRSVVPLLVPAGFLVVFGAMIGAGMISAHTPDPVALPVCLVLIVLLGWGLVKAGPR